MKNFTRILTTITLLLLFGERVYSQASAYTFSQSTGSYTSVGAGTTVHASGWDDAVSAAIPIPFTFAFNSIGYSSCRIASNGHISFGTTPTTSSNYTPISGTTGYAGAISAFGRDLISNSSTVVYATIGSSPNRVFVVQWNNARRYNLGAITGDVLNFQILLYETTNVVEIVYGTCTATNTTPYTCEVGLRGASNSDFNNRSTTSDWSSTTAGGTNSASCTSSNTIMPASGLTFTWTPPACFPAIASAATLVTSTTAQANWNLNSGNFILEYGPTSTFAPVGTGAAAGNANNTVVPITNDNKASLTSLTASTGYSYVVRQDCGGSGFSANSSTIVFTTLAPPPANDNCVGAITLTPQSFAASCTSPTAATSAGATQSNTNCSSTATNDDVWFTFTANATSEIVRFEGVTAVTGSVTAMGMDLYTTCGGSNTNCNTTLTLVSGNVQGTLTGLTISTTYFLRVWTTGTSNSATFNICIIDPPPPPVNDDPCGAIDLTVGASCTFAQYSNTSATATSGPPAPGCASFVSGDVWFKVTVPACGSLILDSNTGDITDSGMAIYSSSDNTCTGTFTLIACDDDASANGAMSFITASGLTPGSIIFIRFWEFGGDVSGTFRICAQAGPSMTYTSSAITQQIGTTGAGSAFNKILQLSIVTVNSGCPLNVTQLDFSTAGTPGTSLPADITNARVYYTGTTSTYTDGAPAGTQFGSVIVNPSGTMTFTGSQALVAGTNYFWLVYDLACAATGPNLDASMLTNGLTMTGGPYTPTTPDPPSNRTVTALASYTTAANGDWSNPATWACGVPPNGTTSAININHNVNLDVNANVQSIVTVAASRTFTLAANTFTVGGAGTGTQNLVINGTVTVSGGTLNVGTATGVTTSNITIATGGTFTLSSGTVNHGPTGGYNRTFSTAGTGTLNVSGGTLNINGRMSVIRFNQSAGDINVDGNAGGVSGSSVPSGTAIIQLTPASVSDISMTGGTLTIVDPHANSTASDVLRLTGSFNGPINVTTGHTIRFGNGTSSDAGGNATNGFRVNTWATTSGMRFGNVIVDGPTGTNRYVTSEYQQPIQGDLTINSGGELRISSTFVNGNVVVNSGGILTSTTLFSLTNSTFVDGSSVSFSASTNAQTVSGSGTFRNLTSSPTANFTALTINNSNASGVTISSASALTGLAGSVSGTLTLTLGKVNNSSPLTLGTTSGSNGTLTGGSASAYITGEFRRWNNSGTGTTSRIFPIGSASSYQPCNINFTGSQSTGGVISAQFTDGSSGTTGLPLTDGGLDCTEISPTGFWTIERLSGSGGTYTADVNASGFKKIDGSTAITLFSEIRLLKRPTAGAWVSTDGTPVAPAGLTSVTRPGCTTFSQFAIGGTALALPLELASFTGKTESRSNMLLWETLTEKNVQWHIVERSVDGVKWMEVGKTAGQMDSQAPVKYELEDRAPLAKAYYRLRSVDYDGAENLSGTIVLTRKGEHFGITAAYPSPTKSQVTVQFASLAEETVTIQVTDFAGRLVMVQEFAADNGINEAVLQLAELQSGVYLVRISNATSTAEPMRIVKE